MPLPRGCVVVAPARSVDCAACWGLELHAGRVLGFRLVWTAPVAWWMPVVWLALAAWEAVPGCRSAAWLRGCGDRGRSVRSCRSWLSAGTDGCAARYGCSAASPIRACRSSCKSPIGMPSVSIAEAIILPRLVGACITLLPKGDPRPGCAGNGLEPCARGENHPGVGAGLARAYGRPFCCGIYDSFPAVAWACRAATWRSSCSSSRYSLACLVAVACGRRPRSGDCIDPSRNNTATITYLDTILNYAE